MNRSRLVGRASKGRNALLGVAIVCAVATSAPLAHGTPYSVNDAVKANQGLTFQFTRNNGLNLDEFTVELVDANGVTRTHTESLATFDWEAYNDDNPGLVLPVSMKFIENSNETATDWRQTISDLVARKSTVYAGNIVRESPWVFRPLNELPNVEWRIPDLAPASGENLTVFAAVNLGLYLKSNPLGFLDGNWAVGDTLSELGIEIVNGQIAGLDGIAFSTTPFEFDPDPLGPGWVPTGGDANLLDSNNFPTDIVVLQQHTPEPCTLTLLALGGLLLTRRRRLI